MSTSALVLMSSLALGAAAQGGFHPAGLTAMTGGVALAALLSWRRVPRATLLELACLALAIWSIISAALAGDAADAGSTVAVCVGIAAAARAAASLDSTGRATLVSSIAALGALLALTGLGGVALHLRPLAIPSQGLWRASTALTYANASAGLFALTALVATGSLLRERTRGGSLVLAVTIAGLAATLSRAGIASFILAFVALALLHGPRRFARATAPAIGGALVIAAGLVPAVTGRGAAAAAIAMIGLALGAWLSCIDGRRARALTAGIVVVSAGALAIGGSVSPLLRERTTLASPARSLAIDAAWEHVQARPVTGAGPGRATLLFERDGELVVGRYVHNEYLQILAELGIVGLALLAAILAGAWRLLSPGRSDPVSLAIACAMGAMAAHAALDFIWHVPVVPVLAAAIIGAGTPHDEQQDRRASGRSQDHPRRRGVEHASQGHRSAGDRTHDGGHGLGRGRPGAHRWRRRGPSARARAQRDGARR